MRDMWRAREKRKRDARGVPENNSSFFLFFFSLSRFSPPPLSYFASVTQATHTNIWVTFKGRKMLQVSVDENYGENTSSSFIHLWQMSVVAVATVCILLACGFIQQRASGSWTPAIKKNRGATCYYLIYLMNNKCAWSDLTPRRKRPGSVGELFSFSFFLFLQKRAVYRRTNH